MLSSAIRIDMSLHDNGKRTSQEEGLPPLIRGFIERGKPLFLTCPSLVA
jgi:hypothetical protein